VGKEAMVYPRGAQRAVRVLHGGRFGALQKEPYDPKRPTVCFEELPYQLVSEKRLPLPAKSMAARSATTASTSGKGFATYWCSSNPKPLGDTST
jgi:hypothetical protein